MGTYIELKITCAGVIENFGKLATTRNKPESFLMESENKFELYYRFSLR
jgi:hypothetical protein